MECVLGMLVSLVNILKTIINKDIYLYYFILQKPGAYIIILCVSRHIALFSIRLLYKHRCGLARRFRTRIKYKMVTEWVGGCGMSSTGAILYKEMKIIKQNVEF